MKKYRRSDFRVWRKKGFDAERSLVKKLRELGFWCVRIPTSASSKEPLPDVYAIHLTENPARILSLEVKAVSYLPSFTVKKSQIEKLFEFLVPFMGKTDFVPLAGVALKFLKGPRVKGHWIVKFVDEPQDIRVDIADDSDLELSKPSKQLRAYILKRRLGERMRSEPSKRSDPWYRKITYARNNLRSLLKKKGFKSLKVSQETLHPLYPLIVEKASKREVIVFLVKASKYPTPLKLEESTLTELFALTDYLKTLSFAVGKTFRVAVAVKFLKGSRQKSPWVIKFVKEPQDLKVSLTKKSDLRVRRYSKKTRLQLKTLS